MVPMKVLAAAISQVLGSPLHPTHASISGGAWTPAQWFLASEQGAWYDPSDLTAEKQAFRKNLFTYTESLGVAGGTATYTPNVTYQENARLAPNGQMAMDKIVATATNGPHGYGPSAYYPTPGAIYTMSVYVAYGGMQYVSLKPDNNWHPAAVFDLVNGVVVSQSPSATNVSIESLPDGIFRIAVSGIPDPSGPRYGFLAIQDGPVYAEWSGNGIDGVYVWGFQIEKGNAATAYQPIPGTFEQSFLAQYPNHALFQDYAGSLPVFAVEQPVGLILDKSGRGNHATQATAAARPVLSARKNWLLNTSSVGGTSWGTVGTGPAVTLNAAIAPNAATEASRLVFSVTGSNNRLVQNTVSLPGGSATGIVSIWLRGTVGGEQMGLWNGQSTNIALPPLTTEWVRYSLPAESTATASVNCLLYAIAGTPTIEAWGVQVEVSAPSATTPTTYQRVNTDTDYDTVGFPLYLKFDGVDDFLVTGNIDFTATHEMTVVAGVQSPKTSQGMLLELGSSYDSTFPSFVNFVPNTADGKIFAAYHDAVGYGSYSTAAGVAINANVIAYSFDTAATTVSGKYPRFHLNGVNGMPSDGSSQAAGAAFINAPLYIGRRAGTSTPFLGNLYQLVVRGAATADLAPIESFTADKTGVTLP